MSTKMPKAGSGSKSTIGERKKTRLPDDFVPSEYDVVCGKGRLAFNHPGNQRFRQTIKDNLERYSEAESKLHKSAIVDEIVVLVRKESVKGGFVRQDGDAWYEIGDHHAREKVGHGFREALIKMNPEKKEQRRKMRARNKARRQRELSVGRGAGFATVPQPPRFGRFAASSSLLNDDDHQDDPQDGHQESLDMTPLPLSASPIISATPSELLSALPDDIVSGAARAMARVSSGDYSNGFPPPPRLTHYSSKELDSLLELESQNLSNAIDEHDAAQHIRAAAAARSSAGNSPRSSCSSGSASSFAIAA